jgi:proteasome assembly chaperone (PAC2) family protein
LFHVERRTDMNTLKVNFGNFAKSPKKSSQLMLYREIIAVCSEIHTKHINTLCGQNVELLNVKLAVHIVTTGLYKC